MKTTRRIITLFLCIALTAGMMLGWNVNVNAAVKILSAKKITIRVGQTSTIVVKNKAKATSSNKKIVKIKKIKKKKNKTKIIVKALKKGSAKITVKVGKSKKTIKVKVLANAKIKEYNKKTYVLEFYDSFEGKELDTAVWSSNDIKETGYASDPPIYDADGYEIKDGALVLKPSIKWDEESNEYVAGSGKSVRMSTRGKKEFKYNKIDVVAKLPKGSGINPYAFMISGPTCAWPLDGEIDLFERGFNRPNDIMQCVQTYRNNNLPSAQEFKYGTTTVPTSDSAYHTYSIEWGNLRIEFFIDGKKTYEYNLADYGEVDQLVQSVNYWPFNKPFGLLLSADIDRTFLQTNPINPEKWTQVATEGNISTYEDYMYIDEVRAYGIQEKKYFVKK